MTEVNDDVMLIDIFFSENSNQKIPDRKEKIFPDLSGRTGGVDWLKGYQLL